jgi:predicted transcriptional regulator
MNKCIISIKQKWIDKIFNNEKIYEIRKSDINKLPCKFYIYSTKNSGYGKIVGEFIIDYTIKTNDYFIENTGCLLEEIQNYGKGKNLYYWHIKKYRKYKYYKNINKYSNIIPNSFIIF